VRSLGDLSLDVPLLVVLNTWQPGADALPALPGGPGRALPNPG